jgi:hypothetical protein
MNSKLPNQITAANGSGRSGLAIQEKWRENDVGTQRPYLAHQQSTFGPARVLSQRVNLCCVSLIWMVMQREYTGVYPGSGKRRPYVQRGEKYYISLHLSACVGVTSYERGSRSQVSERERVQRRLLEMLIFYGGVMTFLPSSPLPPSVESPAFPFIGSKKAKTSGVP